MLQAVEPQDDHELAILVSQSDTLATSLCTLLFDLEFSFYTVCTAWRANCGKNVMCMQETSGIQVGCGQTHKGTPMYLQAFCTTWNVYTVGSESIAMFGSFGLFVVWCFTVWKSHLALQRESKVLLLGFLMEFSSYNLNQWLWGYALFKMEIPLQHFLSF